MFFYVFIDLLQFLSLCPKVTVNLFRKKRPHFWLFLRIWDKKKPPPVRLKDYKPFPHPKKKNKKNYHLWNLEK